MKKRYLLISLLMVLLAGGVFIKSFLGTRPLKDLSDADISNVSVQLLPPDVTLELGEADMEKLAAILRTVVVYHEDDSWREYAGQAVIYTITKTDGTQTTVQAYNPFLIVDGVGYKTKYGPCQELNRLGNRIRDGAK